MSDNVVITITEDTFKVSVEGTANGVDGAKGANWRGEYNPLTQYAVDDLVHHTLGVYICKLPALGITPTNGSYWDVFALDGAEQDISTLVPKTTTVNAKALSANIVLDTDDIADVLNKRYVTDANLTVIGNTSGTNSGDITLAAGSNIAITESPSKTFTIAAGSGVTDHTALTSIGTNTHAQIDSHISSTTNPHTVTKTQVGLNNVDNTSDVNKPISSATQTALDGKVDENAVIVGATKTKITYDIKGLVTAGNDATTVDIDDSSNRRYVTDAQLTVIGNTSNTNTGDQDLSGYELLTNKQTNLVASSTKYPTVNAVNDGLAIPEVALSTGIISGGALTINGGDNTKLDISAGVGIIVDNTVYPNTNTVVTWAAKIAVTLTNLASAYATDIAIDVNGAVVQQFPFSTTDVRSVIFLGGVDHSNNVSISNTFNVQIPAYGIGLAVRDLARAIGDINLSGNVISANGANLKLNKSAGSTFSFGRNAGVSAEDPHTITQASQTALTFRYVNDNGSGVAFFGSAVTNIDPSKYDDGSGTLASTTGNNYTIQRIIMFSNTGSVLVQYGTEQFSRKIDAVAGLAASQWPALSGIRTAIAIGFIIIKRGTTDLTVAANAEFIEASRFGGIGSSGSTPTAWGDITGTLADQTDLQAALNAKEPAITAGTTSQYWRGDKSWRDFFTDVRAATITGLSLATSQVIAATDTVLQALGYLQAQITAIGVANSTAVKTAINASGAAPIYACRAWVLYDQAAAIIRASGNVTSIADNGVGKFTITFTTNMSDVHYSVGGTCTYPEPTFFYSYGFQISPARTGSKTVSTLEMSTLYYSAGAGLDMIADVQIFR